MFSRMDKTMPFAREPFTARPSTALRVGLRVAGLYALAGALWILFSDRFLVQLVQDPQQWLLLQTYKGWIFVAVTALLLAWLVTRLVQRLYEKNLKIQRLNRTHRLLSGINGTIVRVRERDELLQAACELAVRRGGFQFARVLLRQGSDGQVTVASQVLPGEVAADWSAPPLAILAGTGSTTEPVLLQDGLDDLDTASDWQPLAETAGLRSLAALPIPHWRQGLSNLGWLELGSTTHEHFDVLEMELLREIAADIGLGLETIEKSASLETLAHYDPLTGLPNEALLRDRLRQAIARATHDERVVGLLLVDAPELTHLNDLHGSQVGDRLRRQLADYLGDAVREGDTVARTGRYTFAILLADMARTEDMVELTERLLRGPEVHLEQDSMPIRLALRGGAALFPSDTRQAEQLMRHAALALHNNARGPGNCAFYSPAMNEMARSRLRLAHGLEHAIERHELQLHYQLLVDAQSREPRGAEALLRWESARYGRVSPAEFIPIAEEGKIIHAIGDWVVVRACKQLRRWHEEGVEHFHVSVNVATPQLLRAGFASHLRTVMEHAGVLSMAHGLAIEVTETAFMDDLERAEQVLKDVRELGVQVYLDDFGTGFSSLTYLNRLPVDALKIDRSFIQGLPDDSRAGSLVRAIIALAHSLGLKVIAEGVETREQADWLQARGCDLLQGFLYSRPAPAESMRGQVLQSGMR